MTSTTLSDSERRVLALVELDAELTAPEIAKRARLKTPTVHRILQSFREAGIFAGRTAVVDTGRIGLVEYGIAFSLGAASAETIEAFFRYAAKRPAISWAAEVGGGYDVAVNILAGRPETVLNVLRDVEARFPGMFEQQDVCIRARRYRFWRGYLNGRASRSPRFSIGVGESREELNEQDRQILAALSLASFETYRDLARSLRIPIATFLRRIRYLKERKILLGFGYRLNLEQIGVQQFRVLVFTTQWSAESEQQMLDFTAECPWVKVLTTCLGPWNFELEIDVLKQGTARDVASGIRRRLGKSVKKVTLLPIFRHRKFISFPPAE